MTMRQDGEATRRGILRAGLAAVGGAAAVGATWVPRALAQSKIAPAQVQYQTQPKNGQKCSQCVNFVAPNACKIVSGDISPEGWCIAFAPKNA